MPRTIAIILSLLSLVGIVLSLPLLSFVETSLFFLLGLTVWVFYFYRAFSKVFNEAYLIGWLWSAILHLALLPLSVFIPAILDTDLPLPLIYLIMFVLSLVGLFSEIRSRKALESEKLNLNN